MGTDAQIIPGRHTIITESTLDPNTCGNLPTIYPGSDYSIRLGNDSVGSRSESLHYRMTVDPDNPLFIYRYAVVLEDPGHPHDEQPAFELSVLDSNGDLVDRDCGYYRVVSTSNLPGFNDCNNGRVVYKDWASVGIDLSAFANQDLTLVFTTTDCGYGAHFGYAYFEPMQCRPFELDTSDFCPGESINLSAPDGFSYDWSNGATTRSITVNNPVPGDTYTCTMTSLVNQTCKITLSYTIPVFQENSVRFEDSLDACTSEFEFDASMSEHFAQGGADEYFWDFGDGTSRSSGIDPRIRHTYAQPGDYTVTLTVRNSTCEFIRTLDVNVPDGDIPGVITGPDYICLGDGSTVINQDTPPITINAYTHQWQSSVDGVNFTDIPGETSPDLTVASITTDSWYKRLDLFQINGQTCPRETNTISIRVNGIDAQGTIVGNQILCRGATPGELGTGTSTRFLGVPEYQWQGSDDGIAFTDISGANNENYVPPVLENDQWYRRIDNSRRDNHYCSDTTNVVQLRVNDIVPGSITGADTYCNGDTPVPLTTETPPQAQGNIEYQWQHSINGVDFEDLPNEVLAQLTLGPISENMWYRRVDISDIDGQQCNAPTDPVQLVVNDISPGTIGPDRVVCPGENVETILSQITPQASGTLGYQWQMSTDGQQFEDLPAETSENLDPGILEGTTWFRRKEISELNGNSCETLTNAVQIQVNGVTAGVLATPEPICYDSQAAILIESTAAESYGSVSYQWQQSLDNINFENIEGATQMHYQPPSLTSTTWYRRMARSEVDGQFCEAVTDPVELMVYPQISTPEAIVEPPVCDALGEQSRGILVRVPVEQLTGGTGTWSRFDFYWDANTPNDSSDDTLLQSGTEATYIQDTFEDRNIRVQIFDSAGCSGETSASISGIRPLTATASIEEELCMGDLTGVIHVDIEGGYPPYETALNTNFNAAYEIDRTSFYGLSGGKIYTVYVRDSIGCVTEVLVELAPSVDLTSTLKMVYYCYETNDDIRNSLEVEMDPALLDGVLFTLDNDSKTTQIEPDFHNLSPGEHHLTIAYKNGCVTEALPFIVQEIKPLGFVADTSVKNTVKLSAHGGTPPYEFRFNNSFFGPDTDFTISETGEYEMMVRDAAGCERVLAMELEFFPIYIPNFFTPNGDTTNNEWRPTNIDQYPGAVTLIYDRYGRVVARLGYLEPWDGTYEGMPLPSGDYWYVVEETAGAKSMDPIMGHFTLYR
ncbi:T9SS type B sorting domain-containing protein [Sediminicola luteus]|nr:T9SS type B sorting domain-containing protein [Sediminicola luteus]